MEKNFSFSNQHVDLMQRDAESIMGWRYQPSIIFERGKGTIITDVDGNDYYDLTSGMMCMVLGHSHPELTETIKEQAETLAHESSWYSNRWSVEFAELIASTLPGNLKMVNFAVTGSEANEIAMRMAIGVTGKHDIVSVLRGLHGGSLAAESVTSVGGERKGGLGPLMLPARANAILAPFCFRCPVNLEYPSCDIDCLKLSEDMMEHMTSKSVAAIMAESIIVPGGMIVPPKEWLPRLRKVADDWGSLLVLDEAQLAPGRTGKLWAFEHYDVMPDIVTFAKGMSAGMAICGTVTTPEIAEACDGKVGLPWAGTYSGDPLPAAVALKQLQIVLRDKLTNHRINDKAFQLTLGRGAEEAKAGKRNGSLASMFKYYGTEQNKRKYELMLDCMGTQSVGWEGEEFDNRELATTRQWLRSKANSIEGGTSEIQLNVIAKRVLGLPD